MLCHPRQPFTTFLRLDPKMSKWFLQVNGQVKGPFSNESMQAALAHLSETQLEESLFWKRGLTEWMKGAKWRADLAVQQSPIETVFTDTKANSETTKSFSATFSESDKYRVQLNFVDQALMTKAELMTFITKQKDVTKIAIQNNKTKEWSDVYAFPEIVERLGISRRKNSRVPILATFVGISKGSEVNVKVVTISEGGMGFTEVFDLKIGDQVEGQLISPHFFQPIHLKADVIYSGLDGYIGLKFSQVNDESKSAIIEYVKKFGKSLHHP